MLRLLLDYQLVFKYTSVNLETYIGLSISLKKYKRLFWEFFVYQFVFRYMSVNLKILLVYQLALWYIRVNRETFIGFSICFKMYKR